MSSLAWNAAAYDSQHSYVWKHGLGVVELLDAQPGERILDLGCGTGHLTAQITQQGAEVVGLDSDPDMIRVAHKNYPHLSFRVGDGMDFQVDAPFDAVFSSAAIHWMPRHEQVVACVWDALKPGGRFVAELGGKGNIAAILDALYAALRGIGVEQPEQINPWTFPSLAEFATLLERQGFRVTLALHFDRPTLVEGGEEGMRRWLGMFAQDFLAGLTDDEREAVVRQVETTLRPRLVRDGTWVADYVRLRVMAVRES